MTSAKAGRLAAWLAVVLAITVEADGPWMQVGSRHFRVVGQASEDALRDVTRRLEEFRAAVFQLLPGGRLPDLPTVVVLFPDHASYRPFTLEDRVHRDMPAYVVSDAEASYIVVRFTGPDDPRVHLLHEYAHVYIDATLPNAPVWLSEGLADYFSTSTVSEDGTRATTGGPISAYVQILRKKWLPLHSILGASKQSPLYLDQEWAGPFYAESWAFVRYLHEDPARRAQMLKSLKGWDPTTPYQDALQSAFGCSIDEMERRLRDYVTRSDFAPHVTVLQRSVLDRTTAVAERLGDGAVEARLGDLLVHLGRPDEAERRLEAALRLAPGVADLHRAIGHLRLMQGRAVEGLQHLRRAASAGADDFDTQMAYGRAVLASTVDASPADLAGARSAFERAAALRPDLPEALVGVARAYLAAGDRLDLAQEYAERAARMDPSNPAHELLLAQIHSERGDPQGSLAHLGQFGASKPGIAGQAAMMAKEVAANNVRSDNADSSVERGGEVVAIGPGRHIYLRKMNVGERRVFGTLDRIDCDGPAGEMVLVVKRGDRILRFAMPATGARFVSYREDVKATLDCGARDPGERVLVTWRAGAADDEKTVPAGRLAAVEWVPKNYLGPSGP